MVEGQDGPAAADDGLAASRALASLPGAAYDT
ncbi:hypothetical protein Cabther_A0635 [Chloracidobacterium thermophilum B]|uniref:Uncharacterized protein n=1 Tax=Chloracidobacterium thermophilum (strain B) TaxID=981222 RepID=G2LFJ1_CHLTF|nr:hypothetical protein Cabther_A0635 [Chloracidobacterium thermophilum B]